MDVSQQLTVTFAVEAVGPRAEDGSRFYFNSSNTYEMGLDRFTMLEKRQLSQFRTLIRASTQGAPNSGGPQLEVSLNVSAIGPRDTTGKRFYFVSANKYEMSLGTFSTIEDQTMAGFEQLIDESMTEGGSGSGSGSGSATTSAPAQGTQASGSNGGATQQQAQPVATGGFLAPAPQ